MSRSTTASAKSTKSGLTGPKVKPLTGADRQKFLDLVKRTGSHNNSVRVIARLHLNAFALKHGEDRCKATHDAVLAERRAKLMKEW